MSIKFAVVSNLITGSPIYSRHRSRKTAERALAKASKKGASFKIVELIDIKK